MLTLSFKHGSPLLLFLCALSLPLAWSELGAYQLDMLDSHFRVKAF